MLCYLFPSWESNRKIIFFPILAGDVKPKEFSMRGWLKDKGVVARLNRTDIQFMNVISLLMFQ